MKELSKEDFDKISTIVCKNFWNILKEVEESKIDVDMEMLIKICDFENFILYLNTLNNGD